MQNKQIDLVIIGAGPAGIFTALEMLKKGSRQSITIIEKAYRLKNAVALKRKQAGV